MKLLKIFKKKKALLIAIAIIIVVFGFFLLREFWPEQEKISPITITGIILFEGDNCPQCDRVDVFIKNNKIEESVIFTRLEVFHNPANMNLLEDRAQACGLDSAHIGVPLLWDGASCIIGYVDVIEFFRKKIPKN